MEPDITVIISQCKEMTYTVSYNIKIMYILVIKLLHLQWGSKC